MLIETDLFQDSNTGWPPRDWPGLVARIKAGDREATRELYWMVTGGMRYYLSRALGSEDLDQRVHDCFSLVAQAVQRGEVWEADRFLGFARTIVRRQIAFHVATAIENGQRDVDPDRTALSTRSSNAQNAALGRQEEQFAASVLKKMSRRDREILTRFYLDEHSQGQICKDMSLTATQFQLLKTRAKRMFGELRKRRLSVRKIARPAYAARGIASMPEPFIAGVH